MKCVPLVATFTVRPKGNGSPVWLHTRELLRLLVNSLRLAAEEDLADRVRFRGEFDV